MFLLLASLALPVPPSGPPDAASIPSAPSPSASFVDVLVQGAGAATAVAAAGGRPLAYLPLVDGLLARVPAAGAADLARRPGVRAVTDADRPLQIRAAPDPAAAHAAEAVDSPAQPPPGSASVPHRGALLPVAGVTPAGPTANAGRSDAVPAAGAGRGVGVAVLDTGIADAADLVGRVVASADLSGEWSFTDSYGHGTFMAGLIAGSGRGGGPAGVAPGAHLVDLKVAGADGATTLGQVLAAMQLAAASRERFNLRVLNVSLGAPADDPATAPLTEAVERLWAERITVVAAAGNDGGGVDAPGLDPYVVTVGAVDGPQPGTGGPVPASGAVPAWSSRGPDFAGRAKPDLLAPGVGLVGLRAPGSTVDRANPGARVGDDYFRGSGTSMSTALVAGAAALVAADHPDWGPDRVKAALTGDPAANTDLFPLRSPGRAAAPAAPAGAGLPAGLGWRSGGPDGLRWAPAADLPRTGAGTGEAAWTAHPWLGGRWAADAAAATSWAAQQWLARTWAARRWAAAGLPAAAWAALQWSWGGLLAAALDGPAGRLGLAGVDWLARSWAARSWAERAWGPGDLAARSWAARSWAELAWEARSWAARSWAAIDWTARSWASRRWSAGSWAARSWARGRGG